jgi:hypothetical protein
MPSGSIVCTRASWSALPEIFVEIAFGSAGSGVGGVVVVVPALSPVLVVPLSVVGVVVVVPFRAALSDFGEGATLSAFAAVVALSAFGDAVACLAPVAFVPAAPFGVWAPALACVVAFGAFAVTFGPAGPAVPALAIASTAAAAIARNMFIRVPSERGYSQERCRTSCRRIRGELNCLRACPATAHPWRPQGTLHSLQK